MTIEGTIGGITLVLDASISGGGGSGTVSSIAVSSNDLTVTGSPVTTSGTINLSLVNTAVSAGTYIAPNITIDGKGRITAATSNTLTNGTVTSVAVSGGSGITVAGSPVTTSGTISLSLGDITPSSVSTGIVSATDAFANKITVSALVANTGQFAGIVSALDLNVTNTIKASAANITSKLTGATAAFSSIVSADGGINTTTVSATSIGVTGDINSAGRVIVSAATVNNLLTGNTASFSGIVSALELNTNAIRTSAATATGQINANALNAGDGNFTLTTVGGLVLSSNAPRIHWYESDGGSDQKLWRVEANGNILTFATLTDVGGAGANIFTISRSGTAVTRISLAARVRLQGYTVATLPSSPLAGDLAYVTDANATTFNSTVAGGGANTVKVFYNGANWVIG